MKVSIWKVVIGLVLIALLIGAGGMMFRAGYARGTMSDMSFEDMPFAGGDYAEMMPYGGMPGAYGMRSYHGYSHFSFGRRLFGGFVFFLFIGAMFRFFGMRRYGYGMPPWAMHKMHRMHREGKGGPWMHHDHPCWDEKKSDGEDEAEEESEA